MSSKIENKTRFRRCLQDLEFLAENLEDPVLSESLRIFRDEILDIYAQWLGVSREYLLERGYTRDGVLDARR